MPADAPTILAASGGIRDGRRTRWEYSALTDYAIELSGVTSRRTARLSRVATALGDDPLALHQLYEAAQARGARPSHLTLFPMPNVDDISPLICSAGRGVGVRRHRRRLYRGTEFVEAVSERDGAAAYFVEVDDGTAVERRVDTRRL